MYALFATHTVTATGTIHAKFTVNGKVSRRCCGQKIKGLSWAIIVIT